MKRIDVVAAIIVGAQANKILITKRPDHLHKGGYWEFPGGKTETGETEEEALRRELYEELNLEFREAVFFQRLEYDYPEKKVSLSFWRVSDLLTEPKALEGQQMAWVNIANLSDYQFPEANVPIVKALMSEDTC